MTQKSTVKSGLGYALETLGIVIVLVILPALFYSADIKSVDHIYWYYPVIRAVLGLALIIYIIREFITMDNDNADGIRAMCVGIAVAYAIVTFAGAAQYRSDKSDGIAPTSIIMQRQKKELEALKTLGWPEKSIMFLEPTGGKISPGEGSVNNDRHTINSWDDGDSIRPAYIDQYAGSLAGMSNLTK